MRIRKSLNRVLLCVVLGLVSSLAIGQNVPIQVVRAAEDGLRPFLARIPEGAEEEYGLAKGVPLDKASLGDPFPVFTIRPSALTNFIVGMSVGSVITQTKMWYFPVMIGQESKSILVVDQMDGRWQAVSLGYADLARHLGLVRLRWPESKGYHPLLVTVFWAEKHFFTVPEKDAFNLTPLKSGRDIHKGAPYLLSDYSVLDVLSNVVKELQQIANNSVGKDTTESIQTRRAP